MSVAPIGTELADLLDRTSPLLLVEMDDEGTVVWASTAWELLFRVLVPGGLVGTAVDDFVPADRRARHLEERRKFRADPRPVVTRVDCLRQDGTSVPVILQMNGVVYRERKCVLVRAMDLGLLKRPPPQAASHLGERAFYPPTTAPGAATGLPPP
jgi:PAS domain-containing protein